MSVAAWLAGCGGESEKDPDVVETVPIDEQKVELVETVAGVTVSGEPGAIVPSARVDVANASTGQMGLADMAYGEEPCSASADAGADESIRQVLADGDLTYEIEATRLTITRGIQGVRASTE